MNNYSSEQARACLAELHTVKEQIRALQDRKYDLLEELKAYAIKHKMTDSLSVNVDRFYRILTYRESQTR